MAWIGSSRGIFKLHESDAHCGSFLSVEDAAEILAVPKSAIELYARRDDAGRLWISELELHKRWGAGDIKSPHEPKVGAASRSFDELILMQLASLTFPASHVQIQVPFRRKRLDLAVTVEGVTKGIEFLGPSHFIQEFRRELRDPNERKNEAEDVLGFECVLWPYWIQRCSLNVKALFDPSVRGMASVWSTKAHFGDFQLPQAARVIEKISRRFGAIRNDGIGYMYLDTHTAKPIHPIVNLIACGREQRARLIPRDSDRPPEFWLPSALLPRTE